MQNMFADYLKVFSDPSIMQEKMTSFMDGIKSFSSKQIGDKMPSAVDLNAMARTQRKNMETFSKIGQVVSETAQSLIKRQNEILHNCTSEGFNLAKDVHKSHSHDHAKNHHMDFAKNTIETNLANMRDQLEVASKMSMEVFDICSARLAEVIQETASTCKACPEGKKSA